MTLFLLTASSSLFMFSLILSVSYKAISKNLAVQNRLKNVLGPSELTSEKAYKERRKQANRMLTLRGKMALDLASTLSCAGVKLRSEEFLMLWLLSTVGPSGLCLLLGFDWIIAAALLVVGFSLPILLVRWKKTKRTALLEDQLSNALVIIGNCLRTGLSFQGALESIVREMPEPISKEFGRVLKEVQLGLTMEAALENMAERLKSKDFMLIVSAVLIQRQVGGSLSDIMQNISDTIRERLKVKANLRVLTTTGRTSGRIIGALPVFLMLILMVINPSYIRSFFETQAGTTMLIIAGVLEVLGYLVTKQITRVKY